MELSDILVFKALAGGGSSPSGGTGDMEASEYDPILNGIRNLPATPLISDEWTINAGGLQAYQTAIETASATAKTLTVDGISASGYIAIGVRLAVTTACAITYTNINFSEGAPALTDGDVWLFALESVDNGTSYNALATQLVKGV